MPASLFQLMQWIEVVAYVKKNDSLCRIKEARLTHHYQSIPFDIYRSSIALFMTEIIQKVIKGHEANPLLYQFIHNSFLHLDTTKQDIRNFHLIFLLEFTHFLGFRPEGKWSSEFPYFDLFRGRFVALAHPAFTLSKSRSQLLSSCLRSNLDNNSKIVLGREDRRHLLHDILNFYRFHLDRFPEVKTHKVLAEVFN